LGTPAVVRSGPRRLEAVSSAQAGCVAVVGGGVIGLATAFELVDRVRECIVVDPAPGRGASWAAGGMLSPAAEAAPGEEALLPELRRAAALWPSFARRIEDESSIGVDYQVTGSLLVGLTRSDARDLARSARQIVDTGIDIEELSGSDASLLEPCLAAGVAGAWLLSGDHHVDNRLVLESLIGALKAKGVAIIEDRCVEIDTHGDRVRLVLEHRGELNVDRCVLATGAWLPPEGTAELGLREVRPVRGVTLRLTSTGDDPIPSRTIRAIVDGVHCYFVPRSNRSLVLGATSEEHPDMRVARAGGVHQLLDAGRRVVPLVDEYHLAEIAVGLRPATTDHMPFVATLRDERVVAALGHYRNGLLLAPLAGRMAADLVLQAL
jgi:glycine oxidase